MSIGNRASVSNPANRGRALDGALTSNHRHPELPPSGRAGLRSAACTGTSNLRGMSSHERHTWLRAESRGARSSACFSWKPARSNTKPCKGLGNSSSTGGGATVTRRPALSAEPCSGHPKEKLLSCPKQPSRANRRLDVAARSGCRRLPGHRPRKSARSRRSHDRSRERPRHAARQPRRLLPASAVRQVQAAAGEKRRSDQRGPVCLPRVLQQQRFQVRIAGATLTGACFQSQTARDGASGKAGRCHLNAFRIVVSFY